MRLLIVISINLLITTAAILCADERCSKQNVNGYAVQIAHPTDCRKFYKCDELHNLQEEICPHGLEYDPYLKVCVYPNGFCMTNTTRTVQSVYNCSSYEDGFQIPNYNDNCRSYIICSSGISRIEICDDEQLYDSRRGKCTSQIGNIKCENNRNSQLQIPKVLKTNHITLYPNLNSQCRSYFQCDSQNNCDEIFCENGKLFDTYSNNCEENSKVVCDTKIYKNRKKRSSLEYCPENKFLEDSCINGQYKPDDCYCRKFYLCVSGSWRLQTCSRNQYFNKTKNYCVPDDGTCIDECDHGAFKEDDNNCARYSICVQGKWRLQECEIYQYFNKDLNYCEPDTNNICPNTKTTMKPGCHHGEYREYLDDCTKFQMCVNGIWRIQSCNKDQYFNPSKNYCVPEDGSCRTTTTSTTTTTTTQKPVCYHGEYKEYLDDCTKFQICVNGIWRIQSCNKDQYFNPTKNYCVPEDGTCRTTTTTTTTTTTPKPECVHGEYKEYHGDCTKFYLCVVDRWRAQTCSENQYFNPTKNYCVPEDGTCRSTTTSTTTTTTTTPKPECTHGEYKEYPGDCVKFYLCVVGRWREQTCSENQYFDPAKNYCVPEDGTCRSTTTSTTTTTTTTTPKPECAHGEYKEYPGDCVKFYLCVLGRWREQTCSENQYFDPTKNYCVPEDGTCRSTTTSTTTTTTTTTPKPECAHGEYKEYPGDCIKFYLCVLGRWREQTCSENQYFDPEKNYCVPEDGTCRSTTTSTSTTTTTTTPKPECAHGEYKEYPGDCIKFYLCVLGRWREQTCSENQYFDPEKNYCVPEDGTCRSTTTSTSTTTTTTTPKPECAHGEYKEYPGDCVKFYLCVLGRWREQTCSENQYFDPEKNYCVPEDGTCRSTTTSTSTTTTTTTPKPECAHGEYKEYPGDCVKFYLCVLGRWREQTCSENQYFDPKKNYCVPEDGTCRSTTTSTTTTTTTTTPKPECAHGEYKEYPGDCVKFYLCVLGRWREQTCSENQYFDPKKNYCVPEDGTCRSTTTSTTTTTTTTTPKPECTHGEYKEYPGDCVKFYLCVLGRWREQTCSENQYFDPKKNYCVPEDGTCRSTTTSTTTTTTTTTPKPECIHGEYRAYEDDCTKFEICVLGYWRLHKCSPNQYFNKTKNYCVPEDGTCRSTTSTSSTTSTTTTSTKETTTTTTQKPECENGEFRSYEKDCTKFELCVLGYWRLHTCPDGQYFNETKNYCIPEDGTCRSTTPTTPTTSTSTTSTTTTSTTTPSTPSTTTSTTSTTTTPRTTPTTKPPECIHGEFEEHEDCTKFKLCVNGKWRNQSCPDGLYFNKTKNYCIPEDGTCRPTTPTTPTTSTSTTSTTTTSTTTPSTPSTTTSTTSTTTTPRTTPSTPSTTTSTTSTTTTPRTTPSTPSTTTSTTSTTTTPRTTPSTPSTTTSTTSTTTTPRTTPTTKPPECIHGEFEEHVDCTKFKLCVNGKWRNQSCPDGLYFNKTKNYCIPEDGTCRPTTPTTPTTSTSTTSTTTTSTTTPSTPSTTTSTTSTTTTPRTTPSTPSTTTSTTSTTTTPRTTPSTPSTTTSTTSTTTTPRTTPTTKPPECIHGEFEEHEDCTKFKLCVNGKWRNQSCPDGQYFNKTKNYCIPEDGTCRSTTPTTPTTSTSTTSTTTPSTPSTTTSTTSTTTTPRTTPSTPSTTTSTTSTSTTPRTTPTTKPPECIHGEFEEHEDCTKFKLCVNGKWRNQSCPDGQYFNKTKNYCIPEDGTCRSTTPTTPTTSTSTTSTTTTSTTTPSTPSTTSTTTTPRTTPTTKPPECIHGEFEEHEDCTKFRLCVNGKWRNQSCPDGQYFNRTKNYCIPEDGTCRSTTPTTPTTSTSTTTTTTTSTTTPSTPSTTTSTTSTTTTPRTTPSTPSTTTSTTSTTTTPRTTPTTKPPECIHGEFEEHEDCTKFKLCVNGKWRNQSCPDGQYFNKTKNYCIPEDGTCRSTTPTTPTTSTPTTSTTTTSTTTPSTPSTTTSTTSTTTTPRTTPTTEPPECIHGEFEEHEDCTKFRLCVNGKWRNQSCPEGQYFNKTKNYCIPEDGTCRSTTPTTPTTSTSTTTTTTTSTTTPSTPSTTTSTTSTTTTPRTTPTTKPPECIHGEFEEHEDCTKFRLCVNGKWRNQTCPDGQYFNKTKNYCIPEDGTCRSTTPTTPTTSTSTTSTTTTSTTTPSTPSTTTSTTSTTTTPRTTPSTPSTTTSTTSTTTTPRTTPTTKPPECIHGEFEEHEDCTKFRLCVNGKWRNQSCPDGQYFNKTKNYCIPEDGTCRSTTPTTPTTSTSTTSTTTTSTTTPSTPSTTTSTTSTTTTPRTTPSTPSTTTSTTSTTTTPKTTPTTEPPECIHGEFEEHEDCTKFRLCVNGKWRNQSCPDGQYFNKTKNYCIPEDGTCRSTTPTTPTTSTSTTTTTTTSTTTPSTPSTTTSTTSTTTTPRTTPTTEPSECIHGEFEEHEDCTKFRLCVNGKWRNQTCPDGQYFNKTRNYCIPEDGTCRSTTPTTPTTSTSTTSTTTPSTPSTTTSTTTSTTSTTTTPRTTTTTEPSECIHGEFEEHEDCTKFRLCVNGKWRNQTCPDGQYFNKTRNYCIPEDGTCRSTTPTTPTTSTSTTSTTTPSTPSTTTSTTTSTTSTTTTPRTTPTTEPPECIHGEFEEHEDCTKFRLCVNGKWRNQSCPDGQYFNKTKNYCIPEDGTCRSTTPTTPTTSTSTTTTTTTSTTTPSTPSTTTSTTSTTTTTPKTTTTTEPSECIHGEFEEHEDCTKFRLCVNGKWRNQTCPDGQYFNKTKNYCIPEDGTCRSTTPTTPTTSTSTTSTTTTSTTTPSTPSTTTSTTSTTTTPRTTPSTPSTTTSTTSTTTTPRTTPTTKPPECIHGEFEEHEDCTKFRLCVNGKWRNQTCPDGQYFNKTKNYCIPEDGTCRSTTPTTPTTSTSTTSTTTTSTTTPSTPSTTTSTTSTTTTPRTTTTTEPSECIHGEFEEHEDCTKFRLCVNGKWRNQTCPDGQYFNKTRNYCIPEDGTCRSTTPTTPTTSTSTTSTTTPSTPSTTTSTTSTTTTPRTTTTTEPSECIHGEFEEHEDCTKFRLCVNGKWRNQTCPDGQYFNKKRNYCIPEDGTCRSTTPTTPTTSTSTTSTTTPSTPSTTTSTTTSTTSTTTTPRTTTTTEPLECIHGEFEEHEDCTKFRLCVNGKWRNQTCPDGQYFNKKRNYCIPEDGTCRSTTPTTPTTSTSTTSTTTPSTPSTTTSTTTSTTSTTTTPKTTTTTEPLECIHGEFEEHEDCTKFRLCVNGKWRNQTCPDGQYFNKKRNYCIPEDGTCRSTTPTTPTTSTSTTSTTTTSTTTPSTPSTTTSTTTTTTTTPKTTTTTEPLECIHGEFEEHEDCTKFRLCVNGKWRNQTCPDGQYFNKKRNYCIPEDGTCRSTTPTTPTTSTSTTSTTTTSTTTPSTPSTTTSTTTTTTTTPKTTTTTEPLECIHGEFEEHEDCTKFRLCVNGKWRNQTCPDGQYFNKKRNYCIPEDGTCRSTTPTTPTTSTSTTSTTTTSTTTPSTPSTTTSTTSTSTTPRTTTTTEPSECIHGEFEEHEDCTKFRLCVNGKWRNQTCPDGQYFNKKRNYCIPEDGTCRSTTPTTPTTSTSTTSTTTTSTTTPSTPSTTTSTTSTTTTPRSSTTTEPSECIHGEFEEHEDCTKFRLCVNGKWRNQTCPDGQYFNKKRNYCIPEDGTCRSTTPTTPTTSTSTTSTTTTSTTTPSTPSTTTSTTSTSTTPRTTTTTEPLECIHGEFEEHEDCTKFRLCVNGKWRNQTCPDGQYFNKKKNYCIPEDGTCRSTTPTTPTTSTSTTSTTTPSTPSTTTSTTTSTTSTTTTPRTTTTTEPSECIHGEFGEHEDCTKFRLCVNGKWRNQTCPDGQYFNKKRNYCIPEDGTCRSTTPTTPTTSTSTTSTTTTPSTPSTTTSTTSTTTTPRTSTTTEPSECIHGEFEEYPDDCTRFRLCVSGKWRLQTCPNNQYFNILKNYCIPEDGTCRSTTRTTPTTSTTTQSTSSTTTSTTSSTTIPTTTSTEKPVCIHGEFRKHLDDCTKFLLCVSGKWRIQFCPTGQYFNWTKNYCIPEDGSCRTTTTNTPSTSSTTTTSPTLSTTTPESTTLPTCIHGKFKENTDCTKFWLCVSGVWRLQYCPSGQYFNKDKNYCVPEDGTCRSTTTVHTPSTTTTLKPKCIHGEFRDDEIDCTRFYLCVNGEWRLQYCPKNQYFNRTHNYCVPEDGNCRPITSSTTSPEPSTEPTVGPGCIHGEFKKYSEDCAKFELCVNGYWRIQNCPYGQYFNEHSNHCMVDDGTCHSTTSTTTTHGPNPGCIHGEYKNDPDDCFKFYLCISNNWRHQMCPEDQYFDRYKNFCIPNDGSCKTCVHGHFKEHEEDCTKFYLCVKGTWRTQNCLSNQYFNRKLNYCVINDGTCIHAKSVDLKVLDNSNKINLNKRSANIVCAGKRFGTLLPYPKSCKKYILCTLNSSFIIDCKANMYFNQEISRCVINNGECHE